MNILVIGAGMYVTGQKTTGYGTILPAILEWHRKSGAANKVHIVGTSAARAKEVNKKVTESKELSGLQLNIEVLPTCGEGKTKEYRKVLKKIRQPACAIVAVPDDLHFQVAKDCLNAGLHTLIVKPITPALPEAVELISLAKTKGLYGAVEFHKRWDKQNLILKD